MIYALVFFIGATVGAIVSFVIVAISMAGSNYDNMQEAYNYGFEKGKNSVLEDVNSSNNKYENAEDGHDDN